MHPKIFSTHYLPNHRLRSEIDKFSKRCELIIAVLNISIALSPIPAASAAQELLAFLLIFVVWDLGTLPQKVSIALIWLPKGTLRISFKSILVEFRAGILEIGC